MVMISDDRHSEVGLVLKELALHRNIALQYFSADRLQIQPCAACGSCSGKSYGRCILQDDMQQVLPHLASCRSLVLISPVVFGGPGFHIKKIIDRMAAVGNPRYRVHRGELVKGMRSEGLNYFMVGFGDNLSQEQQAAFLLLHRENRNIMSARGEAFMLSNKPSSEELQRLLEVFDHAQ